MNKKFKKQITCYLNHIGFYMNIKFTWISPIDKTIYLSMALISGLNIFFIFPLSLSLYSQKNKEKDYVQIVTYWIQPTWLCTSIYLSFYDYYRVHLPTCMIIKSNGIISIIIIDYYQPKLSCFVRLCIWIIQRFL